MGKSTAFFYKEGYFLGGGDEDALLNRELFYESVLVFALLKAYQDLLPSRDF
jgi:hypothetical protein